MMSPVIIRATGNTNKRDVPHSKLLWCYDLIHLENSKYVAFLNQNTFGYIISLFLLRASFVIVG